MKVWIKKFLPYWIFAILKRLNGFFRGKYPLALANLNLKRSANAKSLTGKIKFKMAYDRSSNLTLFADKLKVRDYVQSKVGSQYLPDILYLPESPNDLRTLNFPEEFALKTNHGSGAMILVSKLANPNNKLPKKINPATWQHFHVTPASFDLESAISILTTWLGQNYYYQVGAFPEWAYKNIEPRFYIEEIMLDPAGRLPNDYKFFIFNGKCEFVQVDSSRFAGHKRDLFKPDWTQIDGEFIYPRSSSPMPKPAVLDEMLHVSETLASEVDFIRVDLYETGKGVKFGELTNYPEGGNGNFRPTSLGIQLGKNWNPDYFKNKTDNSD